VTGGNEREFLFRRLAAALGRHAGAEGTPAPPREPAPASAGGPDRAGRFRQALEAVGGVVLSGAPEENLPGLGEALRAEGVAALFFPPDDVGARCLAEALVPFGPFTLTTAEEVRRGARE
jgi:hypothetical protein